MLLVVDAGNSRLKWKRGNDDGGAPGVSSSVTRPTQAAQLASCLDTMWGGESTPSRVVVGSVVDTKFEQHLVDWIDTHWAVETQFLHSVKQGWGVTSAYREPRTLGVDRWAALVAARRQYRGRVVIVDCGTALTVDALDAHGTHAGGVIVPGIELMKSCLLDNTQKIFDSDTTGPVGFAANTSAAIRSGATLALVGLVEKMVGIFEQKYGAPSAILLTGGGAKQLQPVLELDVKVHQDLVLDGLTIMAETTA